MISEEISNQMSKKLNEKRSNMNSQIQDAIATAIAEKILPSIQNKLSTQERCNFTVVDRRSSGLQGSPRVANSHETWETQPKSSFTRENQRQMSEESSVDSYSSEQNRDTFGLLWFRKKRTK